MIIKWKKDIEKRYNLITEGLTAQLHFKKAGDIASVPDNFKDYISKKLSDPINTGVCELIMDSNYIPDPPETNDLDEDDEIIEGEEE